MRLALLYVVTTVLFAPNLALAARLEPIGKQVVVKPASERVRAEARRQARRWGKASFQDASRAEIEKMISKLLSEKEAPPSEHKKADPETIPN